MSIEKRKLREVEHSDRRRSIVRGHEYLSDNAVGRASGYVQDGAEYQHHFSNMKFYAIAGLSFGYRDSLLFKNIRGAVALDYCCGNGEIAIDMARHGAKRVHGIDLSSVAIENARALAAEAGVQNVCEFTVMDVLTALGLSLQQI